MKVEVEVSDQDAKIFKETFKIEDVGAFLSSFISEMCHTLSEVACMQKVGIKFTDEDGERIGLEIGKKIIREHQKAICVRCGERLHFDPDKGWVHEDGQVYKKRPDGSDDHCALPRRDEENARPNV